MNDGIYYRLGILLEKLRGYEDINNLAKYKE